MCLYATELRSTHDGSVCRSAAHQVVRLGSDTACFGGDQGGLRWQGPASAALNLGTPIWGPADLAEPSASVQVEVRTRSGVLQGWAGAC